MQLRLYRHIPEDDEFREQWKRLVYAMELPAVFYTWEWARAVANAYGSCAPLLFAAYRGHALVGIVAFACDTASRSVRFLTESTADYCDFISRPQDRSEFIGVVVAELRKIGIVEFRLTNLPEDSTSAPVLRSAMRSFGYNVFARPAYLCAQVSLHSSDARPQISNGVGNKLQRMTKSLSRMGTVTITHSVTWDQFTTEFPQYSTAHIARFLATERTSNLVSRERRAFLFDLAGLLSEQGWFAFSTLKLEGRTIAWNYGFKFGGTWFWYQPTFDTEFQRFSPGAHLLCEVLRQASEETETSTVDMGLGDEGYKARYANRGRQTLNIMATQSRRKKIWEDCRYRAAELSKRSPGIERRLRHGRSQMSAVRKRIAKTGIARWSSSYLSQFVRSFFGVARIYFFEWDASQDANADSQFFLRPLSLSLLAAAAMEYENDPETLQYLMRSARRQSEGMEGFALVNSSGIPVHFCWTASFQGFRLEELGQALEEPEVSSVLIFDSWTPPSLRSRRLFTQCSFHVGSLLRNQGKHPWLFCSALSNKALRGIQGAGFVLRFSLVRKKRLLLDRVSKLEFTHAGSAILNLNPAA